jgi:predicted DNA-binding transcriptional regulator AlpA
MNNVIKKVLLRGLKELEDKINSETCEMTEEEAMEIMEVLSHQALSKDQACSFLNLSRSRFDDLVREGTIPKGRKRRGFKELVWYKDELQKVVRH